MIEPTTIKPFGEPLKPQEDDSIVEMADKIIGELETFKKAINGEPIEYEGEEYLWGFVDAYECLEHILHCWQTLNAYLVSSQMKALVEQAE